MGFSILNFTVELSVREEWGMHRFGVNISLDFKHVKFEIIMKPTHGIKIGRWVYESNGEKTNLD